MWPSLRPWQAGKYSISEWVEKSSSLFWPLMGPKSKTHPRNVSRRIDSLGDPFIKMQIKNQGFPWLIFPWSQAIEVNPEPVTLHSHIAAIILSTSHAVFEYGWQPWKLVISWRFYWTYAFPKSILINGWSSVMNPQPEDLGSTADLLVASIPILLPWIIRIQGCSVISINGLLQGNKWWGNVRNPPYCIGKSWKVNGFL